MAVGICVGLVVLIGLPLLWLLRRRYRRRQRELTALFNRTLFEKLAATDPAQRRETEDKVTSWTREQIRSENAFLDRIVPDNTPVPSDPTTFLDQLGTMPTFQLQKELQRLEQEDPALHAKALLKLAELDKQHYSGQSS